MMQLERISKSHGQQVVLDEVSMAINAGDRIGLTGPNGTGKTTLINIIAELEQADSGQVTRSRDLTLGLLPQEIVPGNERWVMDEVLEDFAGYRAYKAMLERPESEIDHQELVLLQEEMDLHGTYDLEAKAHEVLVGLGFDERHRNRRTSELSGGFRMRLSLAKILLKVPDLLLLDEPTNHLDMESMLWLEQYLAAFRGAMIIITHDRAFLNSFATRIAHLEGSKLSLVKGNYDAFLENREAEEERLRHEYDKQQKEMRHIQSFIDKFIGQPKRSRMVSSRKKMLERIQQVELVPPPEKSIRIAMPPVQRSGLEVLQVSSLEKSFPGQTLYEHLSLSVSRGEKVALVGPNGSGKTTLLKIMAGVVEADAGEVSLGHQVDMYYYTQHQLESLDPDKTVFEEVLAVSGSHSTQTVRNILGAFRFGQDSIDKPILALSGGEKARVALAKMIFRGPNLLLLDEPTNHLDMASREVLIEALRQYQGTIVFIAHDRYFIDSIASRVVEVFRGNVTSYVGSFTDYAPRSHFLGGAGATRREVEREDDSADDTPGKRELERARKRQEAEERNRLYRKTKNLRDRLQSVESQIADLEGEKKDLSTEMARPEVYEKYDEYRLILARFGAVERTLEDLYQEWDELGSRIDEVNREV